MQQLHVNLSRIPKPYYYDLVYGWELLYASHKLQLRYCTLFNIAYIL